MNAVGSAAQVHLGAVTVNRMEFGPPPFRVFQRSIALLYLAALVGMIGGFLTTSNASNERVFGERCLVFGAVLVVAALVNPLRRFSLRYALTLHEHGVLISHKGVEQAIPYSQVQGFSLRERTLENNGQDAGTLRTLSFAWPGGGHRIIHFAEAQTERAFGAVVAQLVDRLADAAQARIGTGGSLHGKDWTLDTHGLHVKGQAPVRLGELAHVDLFDGKVSFWRSGEEMPFFAVPAASANAWLLSVMAQRQLPVRTRPTSGVLGRAVFQKRKGIGLQAVCWIMAGLSLWIARWLITWSWPDNWFGIGFGLAFGGILVLGFAHLAVAHICVYEHGVSTRSLLGNRVLRFSEVAGFQYFTVQYYLNGTYAGTRVNLCFTPGPGARSISYVHHDALGNDSDLEMLRERVSGMVAARLLERLKRGEEVPWGFHARFTKDGLVVQVPKLFGKGESQLVPYNAELRLSMEQGTCRVFIGNETGAAMSVEASADNFYPGLKLLEALRSTGTSKPRIAV
ncbi:hypothetical protein NR798_15370 [Archangium gephyra]|uniref:hypothetical protein n=1 Tax=Archangium gephyra TaxID=48 RepID=UPI0035D4A28B